LTLHELFLLMEVKELTQESMIKTTIQLYKEKVAVII
jgi:hypothetical protein